MNPMTFKKIFPVFLLLHSFAFAEPLDPRFYASREFQNRFPGAFALQPESHEFVKQSLPQAIRAANQLVGAIRKTPALASAILQFPNLTDLQKMQTMNQIFNLQTKASGVLPPQLVLDDKTSRAAFFDFDPSRSGPGRVILNPAKLFKDANPYAALLFLIHETRHSQQFQLAFAPSQGAQQSSSSQAYKAAFTAQKQIFDQSLRASYCDFLTLNNEYEAFLFGNYVMEHLTSGAVETKEMGTWASQYILGQGLRIHLPKLALKAGLQNLLEAFNELERDQYQEIFDKKKSDDF